MVTTQLLSRDYFVSGDKIDEFTLLEIVGGGGEGGIWSAWDNFHDRVVAMKFHQLDDTTRTESKRREELLTLANIQHPSVRKIFKTGQGVGFLYFVMEYYPSGSLSDLLRGKPFAPDQVLKISAQIVSALDFIHQQKVIHRDLKPTNILVNHKQQAFLTDFGIARTLSDSTMALHTGQGTPAYSSPEQHTKDYIDVKTDIYSFGIMLYEMCTGEPPWSGMVSLAIKQIESEIDIPDPREMNPELPDSLYPVLKRLTAFDPGKRPDSLREVYQLLLTVWEEEEVAESFGGSAPANLEGVLAQVTDVSAPEKELFEEANAILSRKMSLWREVEGKFRLGATQFIYLEEFFRKPEYIATLNQEQIHFMALFSIVHGRHISFWWNQVREPADRLAIAENVFATEVGNPVINLMNLMLVDPDKFVDAGTAGEKLIGSILGQLRGAEDAEVIRKAIVLLDSMVDENMEWQETGFSEEIDRLLAGMAVSGEIYSINAASLLGKVRSIQAVNNISWGVSSDGSAAGFGYQALAEIRQTAGNWPKGVPPPIRMQTWIRLFQDQVITDRRPFWKIFLFTWLGTGLAFFFHVFASTRLPSYLVASRILSSFGSGLLFGPIVALGLALTKWVSRRLIVLTKAGRAVLGVIMGMLLVNLGFIGFHYLFLSSPPTGFLILIGSLIFSVGYGLSEALTLSRLWQGVISAVLVFAGLALTTEFARTLAVSPMLYYERGEPLGAVLLMTGFSCILGFVSQLFQDAEPL